MDLRAVLLSRCIDFRFKPPLNTPRTHTGNPSAVARRFAVWRRFSAFLLCCCRFHCEVSSPEPMAVKISLWGVGGRVGVLVIMHGRSRMTIGSRIPTMPGRSTLGFTNQADIAWRGRGGGDSLVGVPPVRSYSYNVGAMASIGCEIFMGTAIRVLTPGARVSGSKHMADSSSSSYASVGCSSSGISVGRCSSDSAVDPSSIDTALVCSNSDTALGRSSSE